jgi:hypothetical protein
MALCARSLRNQSINQSIVIALLQLSESVLSSYCRFVDKVNHAASDVDRIIYQVSYLAAILNDLNSFVGEDGGSSLPRLSGLAGDQGSLAMCAECVEELKAAGPSLT